MNNTEKNPKLVKLSEGLSKSLFNLTPSEALSQGICISCKKPIFYSADGKAEKEGHIYSCAGQNEYRITALCEYCFDKACDGLDAILDYEIDPDQREEEIINETCNDKEY